MIDLKGGGPKENADKFKAVLEGGNHTDAKRDAIVLNAGVGCYVYGQSSSIEEGCKLARSTLESGKAAELLQKWIAASQRIAGEAPAPKTEFDLSQMFNYILLAIFAILLADKFDLLTGSA